MTGPVLGKAYIEIQPDLKKFGQSLTKAVSADAAQAANGYNRHVDSMSTANTGLASSFATVGKAVGGMALLAGGVALGALAKQSIDLAIAAEDAGSKFEAVFGPSVEEATEFVDGFANKAGFATHEMQDMLATTANVAGGLGATGEEALKLSTDLATMAGDVASFNGATKDTPAVLHAMQSALTGEREALKTYGIVITEADVQTRALAETGKDSAEDLTTLDKALASVSLIAERSGSAMGDLDKTADSTSNTMARLGAEFKDAQVELGEALVPALEQVLPLLERMIPVVAEVGVKTGDAIVDFQRGATWLRANWDANANAWLAIEDGVEHVSTAIGDGEPYLEAYAEALLHLIRDGGSQAAEAINEFMEANDMNSLTMQRTADHALKYADAVGLTAEQIEILTGLTSEAEAANNAVMTSFESTDPVRYASWIAEAAAEQAGLGAEIVTTTDAMMAQVDAERALIDPVFRLNEAHQAWRETRRDVLKDGKLTVEESFALTDAYGEMQGALAGVDEESRTAFSKANRDAMLAAGIPIEEVNALLGNTEESLDGINTGNFQVPLDDQQLRDAYVSAQGLITALETLDGDTITTTFRLNASVDTLERAINNLPSGQHGGHIPTTGPYLLHSGETVLTDAQQRNIYDVVTAAAALAERSAGGAPAAGGGGVTVANTFLGPVGGSMASFAAEISRQTEMETRFARA